MNPTRLEIAVQITSGLLASGHYTIPRLGDSPPDFIRDEVHNKMGNVIGTQPAVVGAALIITDHLIKANK